MKAALAGRQDPRLIVVGRTSALSMTGVADTVARLKAYEAAGVDMLFMAGVKTRKELDEVASAVKKPLFLGGAAKELYDLDYLSARNVRICLQGHAPFNAAVNAIHATLKALRDGKPWWELQNISPPSDLLKQSTRLADYQAWTRDFLNANPKA
jgi:oxaloacetate decarboxylase